VLGEGNDRQPTSTHTRRARIAILHGDPAVQPTLLRVLGEHWNVEALSPETTTAHTISAGPPDLIITDTPMWSAIRSQEGPRSIPVVVVVSPAEFETIVARLDPEHDDYLTTPFTDAELLATVATRVHLQQVHGQLRYRAALLEALIASAPQALLAVSKQRKVLACNHRFEDIWRLPSGTVQRGGDSPALMRECLVQVVDPDAFEGAIRWGHQHPDELQTLDVALTDGRTLTGQAAPIVDDAGDYLGRLWFLSDDTERRAVEAERAQLLDRLQIVQRSQAFLLKAANTLAQASGFAETLRQLAAVAVPTLGDLCLIDIVGDDGGIRRMAASHADPDQQALIDELEKLYPPDPAGLHPSAEVIRSGRSVWVNNLTDDFLRPRCRDERHFQLVKQLNFCSLMTVPLKTDGDVLGTVMVISTASGRRFGPSDLAVAEDLAAQVAAVVVKARRYEEEHQTAHTLQARLLPASLPEVPDFDIGVRYLPGSREAEVGGDFYDVVVLPNGRIGFMIGDVAGHDAEAAAMMGQLRSAARALAGQVRQPGELIDGLQWSWELLGFERIATAQFGRLDPTTGDMVIASAGHPPPLIVTSSSASFLPLEPASPLGSPSARPHEWRGRLQRGEGLLLYTDGLIEQRAVGVNEGMDKLAALAAEAWRRDLRTADHLCDHVLTGLTPERDDDVAVLAIRRLP
jgi:serine phosphatase RsbU (regulator of sigma subunit)/PAS domain-containing protein